MYLSLFSIFLKIIMSLFQNVLGNNFNHSTSYYISVIKFIKSENCCLFILAMH